MVRDSVRAEPCPNGRQCLMRYLGSTLLVVMLAVAACSSTDQAATSDDTQASSSDGGSSPEVLDVAFDGSECVYAGPGVLPAGGHAFLFSDSSDFPVTLEIDSIAEGHPFQEVLDLQGVDPSPDGRNGWPTNRPASTAPQPLRLISLRTRK